MTKPDRTLIILFARIKQMEKRTPASTPLLVECADGLRQCYHFLKKKTPKFILGEFK